jgi:hypothetical protein
MKLNPVISLFLSSMVAAVGQGANAQNRELPIQRSCLVVIESEEGEWVGSRDVSELNGEVSASRDSYEWRPKERIEFAPGMTLKWFLSYRSRANADDKKEIPDSEVLVFLNFWMEAQEGDQDLRKPEPGFLHIYRSTDPQTRFSVDDVSLTTRMFWHQFGARKLTGKGVVELDDMLSFGSGFDRLVWNVRSVPRPLGGTYSYAEGVLPVAKMRGKTLQFRKLRKLLDKKEKNFREECHVPIAVPMTSGTS